MTNGCIIARTPGGFCRHTLHHSRRFDCPPPFAAASHPEVPLRNPMELFAQTAVHGGTWRCGYTLDSIGKALFLCGKVAPAPAVPPERDCA